MSKSTKSEKPTKPYPDFPLFPHASGRWAKKIRGKLHYFGKWDNWQAALTKYQEQRDDLHAGRTPRVQGAGLTIRDLVNRFLTWKKHLLDTGELTARTFKDYYATCERLVSVFGRTRLVDDLAADDFEKLRTEMAKSMGVVSLGNEIQRVRVVFKYADDAALIDRRIRFGPAFKRPSKKALRLARGAKGPRLFQAEELRRLIDAAGPALRAMILLGINAALGNTDCARLPLTALDLDGGWLNYPRPKTGIARRCPLWKETVKAIRDYLTKRREPKDPANAGLVFLGRKGSPWVKATSQPDEKEMVKVRFDDCISKETAKLLKSLGLARPGLNFYALRHSFETIGGAARDQVAVSFIMGHSPDDDDMSAVYRERIEDDRLQAVTAHVRAWLLPTAKKSKRANGSTEVAKKTESRQN